MILLVRPLPKITGIGRTSTETGHEIGLETRIAFTPGGVEITQDPGADVDWGRAFGQPFGSGHHEIFTVDGRNERPPG